MNAHFYLVAQLLDEKGIKSECKKITLLIPMQQVLTGDKCCHVFEYLLEPHLDKDNISTVFES